VGTAATGVSIGAGAAAFVSAAGVAVGCSSVVVTAAGVAVGSATTCPASGVAPAGVCPQANKIAAKRI